MTVKVGWLVNSNDKSIECGALKYSSLASARLRIGVPTAHVNGSYEHYCLSIVTPVDQIKDLDLDVLIISKISHPSLEKFHVLSKKCAELILEFKRKGTQIVTDVCDNFFIDDDYRAELYSWLIQHSECVVVNSLAMSQIITGLFDVEVEVVPDPVEGNRHTTHFLNNEYPTLLWFGHQTNLKYLDGFARSLCFLSDEIKINFHAVSNKGYGLEELCHDLEKFDQINEAKFSNWSLEVQDKAIQNADIVVIPGDPKDKKKLGVSSNRLIQSLWSGAFVVADRYDSYVEFEDYAWLGDDLLDGIEWAADNSSKVIGMISSGQNYIADHYSQEAIANMWEMVLTKLLNKLINKPESIDSSQVKLNLGCGDKLLDGYVNVDLVDQRAKVKPDVIADISDLSMYEDNSVDEILAVHVVEHFWRWEVEAILDEWKRVLRPGGKIILECPNLMTACEEFLKDPDKKCQAGSEANNTMWVFYGDPAWKDPLMCHRWGYTPKSLAELLRTVGFSGIKQEPAEFKMREPRDMRITAVK